MKSFPRSVLATIIPVTVALLLAAMPNAGASAEEHMNQAEAVSKAWISEIDAGKYEESYDFSCGAMRDKVKQDHWVLILKSLRAPWGAVVSRRQLSHSYKPDGVPDLNGECAVLKYDTTFEHLNDATETVVLKWEDGKWRGAGYQVGPKPTDEAQVSSNAPVTETHTEPHAVPQQDQQ